MAAVNTVRVNRDGEVIVVNESDVRDGDQRLDEATAGEPTPDEGGQVESDVASDPAEATQRSLPGDENEGAGSSSG